MLITKMQKICNISQQLNLLAFFYDVMQKKVIFDYIWQENLVGRKNTK